MKLKGEEEIFKEFTRRTATMGTKTAVYLIYQMGFLEGAAPITGKSETQHKGKTLDDFDIWYLPCEKCGYDTGKSRKLQDPRCWRCGNRVSRDYTDRALK